MGQGSLNCYCYILYFVIPAWLVKLQTLQKLSINDCARKKKKKSANSKPLESVYRVLVNIHVGS